VCVSKYFIHLLLGLIVLAYTLLFWSASYQSQILSPLMQASTLVISSCAWPKRKFAPGQPIYMMSRGAHHNMLWLTFIIPGGD
jgi:hypothetical protein